MIAMTMIAIDTASIAPTANRLPRPLVVRSGGGRCAPGRYPCSATAATIKSTITATTRDRWAITHPGRGQIKVATVWLDLPVLRAVVLVVGADGVRDDDWVATAEVVVEPLRV